MSKYLAVSLLICSLVIGVGIGYYFTPAYAQQQGMGVMGLGIADRYIDLRYINAMASHHRGAILLAEQVKNTTQRQEIKDLAGMILQNEPKLITELYTWKQQWYKDSSKVKDPVVVNLGSFDDKLDLRFLNALIAHHQAGVEMSKEALVKSSRNDILNNAAMLEDFLTQSGQQLKTWRSEWYGIK